MGNMYPLHSARFPTGGLWGECNDDFANTRMLILPNAKCHACCLIIYPEARASNKRIPSLQQYNQAVFR